MDRRLLVRLMAAALLVSLAGCGTADRGSPPGSTPSGTVTVSDPWVRPAPTTDSTTAGYMTITNRGSTDDALLSATSPVASDVELHETSMDSGMAGMKPVDRVSVTAGGTVKLEPGGYHLMLMGLSKTLAVGDSVDLELTFEHMGRVVVQAEVRQG